MCTLVVSVLFIIPLIVLGLYLVFKRRLFENYFNLDLSKGQLIPSFFTPVYRILWIAGFKKQGVLSKKWYKSVKLAEENNRSKLVSLQTKLDAEWDNVEIDLDKLKIYNVVCSGAHEECPWLASVVSACFPESLFISQWMLLISSSDFPVSPLGLIHIRQSIKVYQRPSKILESKFDLKSVVSDVRCVDKGVEVDIKSQLYLRSTETCIWEGTATLLSRSKEVINKQKQPKEQVDQGSNNNLEATSKSSYEIFGWKRFHVDGDTGLKYAKATHDYNPHHLYPKTAQLLGYDQPIAHGLWTLQRSLNIVKDVFPLEVADKALSIDASFKKPLFLPSDIKVTFWRKRGSKELSLTVTNAEDERNLHLTATLVKL